jgi:hypothetical protein
MPYNANTVSMTEDRYHYETIRVHDNLPQVIAGWAIFGCFAILISLVFLIWKNRKT